MTEVEIELTTMGFRVPVSLSGIIGNSDISIGPFARIFEYWEYDSKIKKYKLNEEFFYFDKTNGVCCFPKYALPEFEKFISTKYVKPIFKELSVTEGKDVEFLMLPHISYKNDKQKNAVEYLTNEKSGHLRGVALQTGAGKAQPMDALIRTPDGWDEMRDMVIGKEIIAGDGSTTTVVGVYPQGVKPIYRITFEDGRTTECCDEHLWKIHYVQWKDKWRVLPLKDIRIHLELNPTYRDRLYVPLIEPIEYPNRELPIDPYLLGALIGNGNITQSMTRFSSKDKFVIDKIKDILGEEYSVTATSEYDYQISHLSRKGKTRGDLRQSLSQLGLDGCYSYQKFIPEEYQYSSIKNRLSLIQGLMDTDGYVGKNGGVEYTTSSERLAKDIQELIWGLGGLCKISEKIPYYTHNGERRKGRRAYTLHIRYKSPKDLVTLPRRKERIPENYQYADRLKLRIRTIEYIGKKEAQCIMVDHPDHLYVTDNYVVTHNTVSFIWAIQKLAKRSMITMTSRLEQWVREFGNYTNLVEDDIYIIQGSSSLTRLVERIDKEINPKIILASTRTMRLYLEYDDGYKHLPHPTELCKILNVGIFATDEYHEHFKTNLMMMLAFNPKIFIPITATFSANSPFVKNIFNNFIPKDVQFEGGEYDKYVNVTAYHYSGSSYLIKPYQYTRAGSYNQNKFEEFLTSKKGKVVFDNLVSDAVIPIIKQHYINIAEPGEKFLMICSSKEFCNQMVSVMKRIFPDKKVTSFFSGMPDTILERYDMIFSTPGSAGTGRDIKGLRTCFAFENTASETRNLQFLGRLRGPPQMMNTPEFVYLNFKSIPKHNSYNNMRSMLYGPRALTFKQRNI